MRPVPLVLAALLLAVSLPGQALHPTGAAAARPPGPRPALIAAGPAATTSILPDGAAIAELPWLLPGDDDPAVSPDGRRVAFSSARGGDREIYVADAVTGEVRRLTTNGRADDRRPAWSPDGRRIAWQSGRKGSFDLFVMDASGARKRALVRGVGDDVEPAWSPDGTRVAFASNRAGHFDLWLARPEGGEPELLLDARGAARSPDWSPDGEAVAYAGSVGTETDIWLTGLDAPEPRRLTRSRASELAPAWSPDGRRVAFVAARGGSSQIRVVGAAGGETRPVEGTRGAVDVDWAIAMPSLAPGPEQLLPDLDQQAPAGLRISMAAGRFSLGFDSAVDNLGRGPLRIRGVRPPGSAQMAAEQMIELAGGGTRVVRRVGRLRYEAHPPHRHWHVQPFERYELRRAATGELVGRDRKSGFCLVDRYGLASVRVPRLRPPRFVSSCGQGAPQLRRVEEGSSPGYVDRYPAFFHGQDVDVTGLPAGEYLLVHRANHERLLREARYSNNAASARIRIAWPRGVASPPTVTVLARCGASERCP